MARKRTKDHENKMVTAYANTSISINGVFIGKWESKEIDEATAKKIKASRLAKMVDFK